MIIAEWSSVKQINKLIQRFQESLPSVSHFSEKLVNVILLQPRLSNKQPIMPSGMAVRHE